LSRHDSAGSSLAIRAEDRIPPGGLRQASLVMMILVILSAAAVLIRAITARNATLIVTLAVGFVAILLAAVFGSGFTDKLTNGYSLGMALAFAAALTCYAVGLYALRAHPSSSS
jgi:hypothetical protein